MKKLLILAAVLFSASVAFAQAPTARAHYYRNTSSTNKLNLLEGVALNAAAASRTITIPTGGFSGLKVNAFYTYAAATTVTASMQCSFDDTNYAVITSRNIVSGAAAVAAVTDTVTTGAANQYFQLFYPILGCTYIKIVFGGAGAGANDLINVQAVATVGG